jgi:hypothetical protein
MLLSICEFYETGRGEDGNFLMDVSEITFTGALPNRMIFWKQRTPS